LAELQTSTAANATGTPKTSCLNSLLFEPQASYSLEDLIARVQQSRFGATPVQSEPAAPVKTKRGKKNVVPAPPPSPREMIAKFKHQGWLFNGISGPGRYLFQVPADLKSRFRDTLARRLATDLEFTEEPPFYRDEQTLMEDDVTQLLHYIYHNEVQLTADGSMYKRFTLQLLSLFGVQEELPAKGEWRFGYGKYFNHYPNRFSLIYDFCAANRQDWRQNRKARMRRYTAAGLNRTRGRLRICCHSFTGLIRWPQIG
jgi:hypothetical protein